MDKEEEEIMALNKMRLLKKKIREGKRSLVYALLRELRADFNAIENCKVVKGETLGGFIIRMKASNGDEFWVADDGAKVEEEVDGLPVLRLNDMEKLKELLV